ncbi:MAG: PAS domain S-box protein [Candidatus Rokubacteria bacterium]|nr:PAS domain S-box protein [Candidatus Rokubacteria bacterium]
METPGHLIENAGLLILGVLVYSYVGRWLPSHRPEGRLPRQLVLGLLFGAITVVMMIERIEIRDGLFIDARWVPVALVGLFEGATAGLIAGGIGAAYRLWGWGWGWGAGALPGVLSLLLTGLAAGLVHSWAGGGARVGWRHTLALGGVVCLIVAGAYLAAGQYGARLLAHVWWLLLLTIVLGITLVGTILRDQVERERLLEERARFRAVLDEATDAIRIVDPDTLRILETNRKDSELMGVSREALIGRRLDDLWPADPETRAAHEKFVRQALQKGEATSDALSHPTRAGEPAYLGGTGRVVEYGGKRFAVFIFRDMTDRLKAEEARREAEAMKAITELARATAHEINNPLTALIGNLELLRTQGLAESEKPKWVDVAVDMGFRIRDIVARLMRITRREVDRGIPEMPMLDIRKSSDPEPRPPDKGS